MTTLPKLNIPIGTTFTNTGIKAASKQLTGLEGLAKQVTKTFVGVFAAAKIAEFGKASISAFANESKQAAIFGQTITSLGFAMQQSGITEYITKISEQTGILKDQLEPAFASLLRYTRNVSESQKLFGTALNVSAGTGKSLLEVSNALGRASQGNYTALVRLGAGITTANAKTLTFQQNLNILNSSFQGDAAAAANSFAGTLDRLKASAHEAMVTIGSGLAAAFTSLSGTAGSFHWIDTLGQKINGLIYDVTKFAIVTKDILGGLNPFNLKNWTGKNDVSGKIKSDVTKLDANFAKMKAQATGTDVSQYKVNNNLLAQAQKDLATQKQITAQKQAQLAAQKAQQVLTAASKVLDVQQAEIIAAQANATLSQDELDRLKLKQALLNDNAAAAAQFAQQVINDQIALARIQDPFGSMNTNIQAVIASLIEMQKQLLNVSNGLTGVSAAGTTYTNGVLLSSGAIVGKDQAGMGVLIPSPNAPTVNVGLTITDNTSGGTTVQQNNTLSGTPSWITRLNALP